MHAFKTFVVAVLILPLVGSAALPNASGVDPDQPIILDKWSRYHTHITTYENPAKKPGGGTDYNQFAWVPKVDLVVQVAQPERDDIVILQHFFGEKPWGDPIKVPVSNITPRRGEDYSLVSFSNTMDQALAITDVGEFSVQVSYKQTALGKLHETWRPSTTA